MNKEEIKYYLKMVDELGAKLTGEDKETYTWLIYGYNQCAKLLNETEQQCKKQKEVIDKIFNYLEDKYGYNLTKGTINDTDVTELYEILKEVSE